MEIEIRFAGDAVEPELQAQIKDALRVALGDEFEDGELVELRHHHGAFTVQAYAIPDPDDPPQPRSVREIVEDELRGLGLKVA